MKKITTILLSIALPFLSFTQPSTDATAPYFGNIGYPNLKTRLLDSTTIYTTQNLPTNKTIVVIFFSPDCEHCQAETQALLEKKDSLQNLFMVWNANIVDEFGKVKEFYEKYKMSQLTNAVVGKEVDYYLPLHYRIANTPYAAVYKEGKLFAEFRGSLSLNNLIAINYNNYQPIVDYTKYKPVVVPTKETAPTKKSKRKKKK